MTWKVKRLRDLADLCLGKMLDKEKNKGELRPYLANLNVRWGTFDLSDLREMRFEDREVERYGVRAGDIVMCEGGEPGRCAIWRDQRPGMMLQKALHRIRSKPEIDHRFLFYSLVHKGQTQSLDQYFTGATIKHLPGEKLALVEVEYPSLDEQRRIAAILSAYDDLIENNTRRIAILEEMARRIYEEWFIRLRFPGHQGVRMVESELGLAPEGWTIEPLGSVCDVTDYVANGSFASLKENVTYRNEPDYAVLVRGTDFNSGWNGKYVYVTEHSYRFLKKSALHPGDIVVTNVGNVGITFFVPDLGCPMTLGPNSVLARPRKGAAFLFHFLRSEEGQHRIHGITSGAAQPKFNKTEFRSMRIAVPAEGVLSEFDRVMAPVHGLREKLRAASWNLRTTRDLLLPKLISGELDVWALPEPVALAA